MTINRAQMKEQARGLIRSRQREVLLTSMIFVLLIALIGYLNARSSGYTVDEVERYMNYVSAGNAERALEYLADKSPTPGESLISMLLNAVSAIVAAGYLLFLLHIVRREEASTGNLLDGFAQWWRVLLLDLLMGLFIGLWSLLLIVPGIIAAYRYRMALYLLLTHPEYSIMECIRRSSDLMKGHKGEMFVLDLSFLGWLLLSAIPVVGYLAGVWVQPYYNLTNLLIYERLSGYEANVIREPPLGF